MNERIKLLAELSKTPKTMMVDGVLQSVVTIDAERFAKLIVRECARLNRLQSYELMGVITDVEEGDGFDDVCLNTVKRVAEHLANDLKEHFGVEE
jgi:hypothetical protein